MINENVKPVLPQLYFVASKITHLLVALLFSGLYYGVTSLFFFDEETKNYVNLQELFFGVTLINLAISMLFFGSSVLKIAENPHTFFNKKLKVQKYSITVMRNWAINSIAVAIFSLLFIEEKKLLLVLVLTSIVIVVNVFYYYIVKYYTNYFSV